MVDPQQQVVWEEDEKTAPGAAAPTSGSTVKWEDAKPAAAAPTTPAQGGADVPQSIFNLRRMGQTAIQTIAHPIQAVDNAAQYYGSSGADTKDESIAKGVGKSVGRTATMIPSIAAHPYDAIAGGNIALKDRADKEAAEGKLPESMLHSVAAGVPLFGPMAVGIGDRLGGTREAAPTKSDIAGGITDIATLAALPKVGEVVKEGAAPGGVLRRGVTSPMTPVPEAAPLLPTPAAGVRIAARSGAPIVRAISDPLGTVKEVGGKLADKITSNYKNYGLTPDQIREEYLTKGKQGVEGLQKQVTDLQSKVDTAKKTSSGYVPDELTSALKSAQDALQAKQLEVARIHPSGDQLARTMPAGAKSVFKGATPQDIGASVDAQQQQQPTQAPASASAPAPKPNIAAPTSAAPAQSPVSPNMGEWKAPEFDEIKSGVKRVGRAGESPEARYNAEKSGKPDSTSLGQFARVNGPRIDAAIPNTPEGQTLANHLHDIKGPELEKVANDLKVDIGDVEKTGKKGTTINREAIINRLLDAGHSPETIVDTHLNRFGNPPPVSGGNALWEDTGQSTATPKERIPWRSGSGKNLNLPLGEARLRLQNPQVQAGAELGNMLMQEKFRDLIPTMGEPVAAKPNIAATAPEASAPEVKVWRDQPGEAHPVKIVYDEHGQPTGETDGRHRVIQALKNGYDRIEVTVDRGNGPQKTTVPVRALARQMGVDEASLANTDSQQSYRAGGGKPRISVKKQ